MPTVYPFLQTEDALQDFVRRWEQRVLPKSEWTHGAHVGVCAFYTAEFGHDEALRRMRDGIPLYNVAVGTANTEDSGYHETLTCLWAHVIRDFLAGAKYSGTYAAVQAAVGQFGGARKLHEAYYSFDVVKDRRARREWVPPDRVPESSA